MAQNQTAAYLVDRIETVYGRMTSKIKARLLGDVNAWVDWACRRWGFWFLRVEVGISALAQFPISDTSTLTMKLGRWWDRGWLATSSGVNSYFFAYPTQTITDPAETNALATTQRWKYAEIGRMLYCKKYSNTGSLEKDLEVLTPEQFVMAAKYDSAAEPTHVTWQTQNSISSIIFTPEPNAVYLYNFGVQLASLEPLTRNDSTHAMLEYYPQTVITAGLVLAAKYFGETRELATYQAELYGAQYAQIMDANLTPGGLIGGMVADTRTRMLGQNQTMRSYASSRRAVGRGSYRRRTYLGGYYYEGT